MQLNILGYPMNKLTKTIKFSYKGWLFISPLVIGILIFNIYPMCSSLIYSFSDYDMINPAENFGFQNYIAIFDMEKSAAFWQAMKNTFKNAFLQIPLAMVFSYLLAVMLKKQTPFNQTLRVLYYLPVLMPTVVSGLIYKNIFDGEHCIANTLLGYLNMEPMAFLSEENAMGTLIYIQLTTIGSGMIIWLAALNAIPESLYEAAEIDGASKVHSFFAITIPMTTPAIFYNLVMGVIGAFQIFGLPYNLVGEAGGNGKALYFIVMHIYRKAFNDMAFSVAAAMSWVLFAFIGVLTLVNFSLQKWIYYGEES